MSAIRIGRSSKGPRPTNFDPPRSLAHRLNWLAHEEPSDGVAYLSASGKRSVAFRRCAVRIDLECEQKGGPRDLVDDVAGSETRVAPRRYDNRVCLACRFSSDRSYTVI